MKFICDQQRLNKSINIISKAVTARTTLPILKGILIEVSPEGTLRMSASDLDITIEDTISVEAAEEGKTVVQAKLFSDIIRKMPNAEVTVEEQDGNIKVSCMNSEFSLIGMSPDEFPNIKNTNPEEEAIPFEKDTFSSMIKKTSFAASADASRGVLCGILTEIQGGEMRMVAIDGYRMAICNSPVPGAEEKKYIISAKIMSDISKIIAESASEEPIQVITDEKSAVFLISNTRVVARVIAGEFIKYQDILPKESKIQIKVNRNLLLESIERASLVSNDGKNNLIKMSITQQVITITSKSEEGNVTEEVLAEKQGDDLEIGFNAKYISDVLRAIEDSEIVLKMNTSISACLIEPAQGNAYQYLILPVRLSSN